MTAGRGSAWLGAALFAICYEALVSLIGWWLFGPPHTLEGNFSLKMTATVGLPSLGQLLDPSHQIGSLELQFSGFLIGTLLYPIVLMMLYALANTGYVRSLAKSQRDLPLTSMKETSRIAVRMMGWMILQLLLSLIMMLLIGLLGFVGGALSVLLLLCFRYYFLFFEYVLVVEQTAFRQAFGRSLVLRKSAQSVAFPLFLIILVVNVLLGYLINQFFSYGMMALMLPLNAILHTMIQSRLMHAFFVAREG